MLLFSDMLYMLVSYRSPSRPMYFRCLMLTLSGPVEFLFCFIADWTCVEVSFILLSAVCVFSYLCVPITHLFLHR